MRQQAGCNGLRRRLAAQIGWASGLRWPSREVKAWGHPAAAPGARAQRGRPLYEPRPTHLCLRQLRQAWNVCRHQRGVGQGLSVDDARPAPR